MFSFYRKHIPQYEQIVEPLQQLPNSSQPTHKKRRKKANLLLDTMTPTHDWLLQHLKSFSALKEGLSKSVLLHHVSPDTMFSLTADASEISFGAVLNQVSSSDENRPLALFFRRLAQAERNYSIFDRELLAIYASTVKLCYLIKTRKVFVFRDKKPIACLFRQISASNKHSPRQVREFSFIAEHIDEIH